MKNSDKSFEIWIENPYPNMSEDFTDYYELIVARANLYKKDSKLESKGILMILVSAVILVLPNILPTIDILSFIRSVLLCFLAFFIPIMHYALANRKNMLEEYITKPNYDGLLNMISNKKANKIISTLTNTLFACVCIYACYLMWVIPFLFINFIACFITVYSCIGIWANLASKSIDNKKVIKSILTEKNMTMKDLYDDIENWIIEEVKE